MREQRILSIQMQAGETPEVVLNQTLQAMNREGKTILSLAFDGQSYLMLYETAAQNQSAPQQDAAPATPKIRAKPDVITLKQGESQQLLVVFENLQPCRLNYRVVDLAGGSVTPEGVYTAPDHHGVFEIEIVCTQQPAISTRLYAAVK